MASCKLTKAKARGLLKGLPGGARRQLLGYVPPSPPSRPTRLAGDAGVETSHCRGINPDVVADVRLGMEGFAFRFSYHGWCAVTWAVGGGSCHGC